MITPQQRRRLVSEAERRGSTIGGLVREAIDSVVGGVSADDRQRAVEEIAAMHPVRFVAPDDLDRLIESEHRRPAKRVSKTTRR
ncbi:hypothetical protein EPN29_10720 [bacterium]|nr:MAG: hypothetical protein EPN29_10720 [bacterium]